MKLYPLLLLALVACGKKITTDKFFEPTFEQITQDSDGDGMGDFAEQDASRDPYVADVLNGLIPPETKLWMSAAGQDVELAWGLRSSFRQQALTAVAHKQLRADLPLSINYAFDVSQQKSYWDVALEASGPGTFRLELPDHSTDRFTQAPRTISPGLVRAFEVGDSAKFNEIHRKTYRLILSLPSGDEVHYVSAEKTLVDFLRRYNLIQLPNAQIQSLKGLNATTEAFDERSYQDDSVWHLVNLPRGLTTVVKAGESYALIYATKKEVGLRNNLSYATARPLSSNFSFQTADSDAGTMHTLFFAHPHQVQLSPRKERYVTGGRSDDALRCERRFIDNAGYAEVRLSSPSDALKFLQTQFATNPAAQMDGKIVWSSVGAKGIAFQVDARWANELTTLTPSSAAGETTPTGQVRDSCGLRFTRESSLVWSGLEAAVFTSQVGSN